MCAHCPKVQVYTIMILVFFTNNGNGMWLCSYRLGISYPELTEMQARAIFQAAVSMTNQGIKVLPEIMVPLVGTPQVFFDLCIFFTLYF